MHVQYTGRSVPLECTTISLIFNVVKMVHNQESKSTEKKLKYEEPDN
jgi:hypothetical protein